MIQNQFLSVAALILIIAGLFVVLKWKSIRLGWAEFMLRRAIKKLGKQACHNVKLSDGMDGVIYVEHLVLAPTSILLLSVNRFKGVIFAGDNIDFWTQVVDRRSFKFENPLTKLDQDVMSMKALVPGVEIKGFMVFTDESEFPKGKPDQVLLSSELKDRACKKTDRVPETLKQGWEKLLGVITRSTET